ncbi:hypothetical protein [Psychrobacillus sp. BM2]|uniref:hypothetical protein n=1 Tax=Psychrobacillus sp. BM2 TaxID=3400421 RepID=UPI003B027DB6
MRNKKTFFYIVIILTIVSSIFFVGFKDKNANNEELTLKETVVLGINTAKKWNENAKLTKLTSNDEKRGGTRGDTGRRYDWNLFFIVPGTDKQLLVGISKGVIDLEQELIGPKDAIAIELDDLKFDSPELLKIAKNRYNLRKGEDWATGYHFTLDIIGDKPTVTVFGIDKDDLFTRVNIDPKSGKITGAIHKVPEGGGLISIRAGSNTPKISKKGMAIKGISGNSDSLVAWGDQKPRAFNSAVQPFIELSNNNGESWNRLNIHQSIVNAWFNSNNQLYVATESELVRIKEPEDKIESILKLKTQIEGIDYTPNNNIAILSNGYIYTTIDDGKNWSKTTEPEPVMSLQISNSGSLIVFTNDRKVLLKNDEGWDVLKIPNEKKPSVLKVINDDLYLIIDNELWVHNLKDNRWSKLETNTLISRLIKKGNNLFGISEEGTIYLIDLGADSNELIENRLFSIQDKIVLDIENNKTGLFIATTPDYIWEEIK